MAKPLWKPPDEMAESSNIARYMRWLEGRGLRFDGYPSLWRWSVDNIEQFWETIWEFFEVKASRPYEYVLKQRVMPGAVWFKGAELNYAEHIFRDRDQAKTAVISKVEGAEHGRLTWSELERKAGSLAATLRELGVRKGDRVAAYLPNVSEAVVALMACASLGAVWTSCGPDFGAGGVVDRFRQVEPKVLIAADGYRYKGGWNDRTEVVEKVRRAVPSIRHVIKVHMGSGKTAPQRDLGWDEVTSPGRRLEFVQVPFDHPLWILYSSGTTGLPKPIVHGHGGVLLEQMKALSFHNDIRQGHRMFWYTSTGWMMWNYLVDSLLLGSTIILYDGDPFYPTPSALWDLADETEMTLFGASAAFVSNCMKVGIEPRKTNGLDKLIGFGSTGSALPPEGFRWVYQKVKKDVWLTSLSGGTDLCTAFVGGVPLIPVYEGEIQAACLGADVRAYDVNGRAVVGEMGELVIAKPMPSMPLYLWGDPDGERYMESYFNVFPGVWRHGDWITINERGGCIIYGRSDATIKRRGVRLGTSEIYRVVESIPQVVDSLVVDTEFLGERTYMPLFIVLKDGLVLDEALKEVVRTKIRAELSPHFVPDEVVQAPEVPRTLSGKKLEVPVRRILLGAQPEKVYNPGSLKDPESMRFFIEFAKGVKR